MIGEKGKKKKSVILKIGLVLFLAAAIFILIAVSEETYENNQVKKEIEKLKKEAEEIQQENLTIRDKIAYFESKDYQEKEAKDKLNLQRPDENVIIIKLGIAKEAQSEENQIAPEKINAEKKSNFYKWWSYFFK